MTASSALVAFDARVAHSLHEHGHPLLIALLLAITHLNSTVAIGAWSALFGAWLARRGERLWMLTLALSVGGAMLLNLLLKGAFERVRPRFDDPLLELGTYSFPSGHTAASVAFYGVLAAFLVSRTYDTRKRAACVAGAIAAVALVAFSRLYLGAHYVSDVLAAMCSSTAWLVLCLATGHALARRRLARRWIILGGVALAGLALAALLPLEDWSHRLTETLAQLSIAKALIVFCALNVIATLLLVPAWIFPLVAGAVFGVGWGVLAAWVGGVAAALAAFLVARYLLHSIVERAARRNKLFKAVDGAVKKEPWKVVALMRMSPVLPSGLKSYFLGLTRVSLGTYASASAAGMLPGVLLKVYVAAAGRGALSEGGTLNWAIFTAGVAATVALTWMVGKRARARLAL